MFHESELELYNSQRDMHKEQDSARQGDDVVSDQYTFCLSFEPIVLSLFTS